MLQTPDAWLGCARFRPSHAPSQRVQGACAPSLCHEPCRGAACLHFTLESLPGLTHPAGPMKLLSILAAALCLTTSAIQSRPAKTNAIPPPSGAAKAAD